MTHDKQRTELEGLCERLREQRTRDSFASAAHTWFNPDGPEAADAIQSLLLRVEGLRVALTFYRDEWEQDVDAERTAEGWVGTIGEVEPSERLLRDRGAIARKAIEASHDQ